MNRPEILAFLLTLAAACSSADGDETPEPRGGASGFPANLIYAAVEEDGTVAVVDQTTGALLRTIDVSQTAHGAPLMFDVHNVQAAPDGRTVWLTAMPMHESAHAGAVAEQLIGIDVGSARVRARIELGQDLHVAHVVIAGETAYVTAFERDSVLVVDLEARDVVRTLELPAGTNPHGARLSPDGHTLVVAGMGDGSMHSIDTDTGEVSSHALPGRAVQAAVLPDGSAAFVTIYDTRQIAKLDLSTHSLDLFDLPRDSAGPAQLYPTADGRLWIADQGILDGNPVGHRLYRMNGADGSVERSVEVGEGPHGVVVDADGTRIWTTTVVAGDVQAIDAESGEVLSTTHVGRTPNGITCVHGQAAMP